MTIELSEYVIDAIADAVARKMQQPPHIKIGDKMYVAEHPKLKTIHGKTGEVVIGGFKEVQDGISN